MFKRVYGLILVLMLAGPVQAQEMTLDDIRGDIAVLSLQLEALRMELSSTGSTELSARDAASALVRIDEINADLRAALGRVETLEIKVRQVIEDGTRRIGDIEFRLTELEGGDATLNAPTTPLGGTESQSDVITPERQAFSDAKKALESGDGAAAAGLLAAFLGNFPDGPLSSEARFMQGEALAMQGDFQNAARSYLSGFSGAPDGTFAPRSLFGLSVSLFQLGQGEQACLTLAEIQIRYPNIDETLSRDIIEQRGAMACP
ncbi:MAG: tol-pal system protein [Rhodobacteraceae bacterium]|nr:tol-pal system protein [Paracoccaceae bacterium]